MNFSSWAENPGIYLGRESNDGIMITGPVSAKNAGLEVAKSAMNNELVVAYKSGNGKWPILEIIMELLYRNTTE